MSGAFDVPTGCYGSYVKFSISICLQVVTHMDSIRHFEILFSMYCYLRYLLNSKILYSACLGRPINWFLPVLGN